MKPLEMQDLFLGRRVRVNATLKRSMSYDSRHKAWASISLSEPVVGIVIGIRTLANGTIHYGSWDEPTSFQPTGYLRAVQVVTSLRKNPIFVPLEGLEAMP